MGPNKAEYVLTGGPEPCPIGEGFASRRLVEKVMQSAELGGTMLHF